MVPSSGVDSLPVSPFPRSPASRTAPRAYRSGVVGAVAGLGFCAEGCRPYRRPEANAVPVEEDVPADRIT